MWLDREFEEEKVTKVLVKCGGDEAPRTNGFNYAFIKASWDFLKEDFRKMLSEFHHKGKLRRLMLLFCSYS